MEKKCSKNFNEPYQNEVRKDGNKQKQYLLQKFRFKLFHAIENNEFITLSSDLFSRKLLFYFYDEDVFKPNSYNRYNPEVDYEFMLQMFNKRNKDSISPLQHKKISAIIMDSIRPYLREMLRGKIRYRREGMR